MNSDEWERELKKIKSELEKVRKERDDLLKGIEEIRNRTVRRTTGAEQVAFEISQRLLTKGE